MLDTMMKKKESKTQVCVVDYKGHLVSDAALIYHRH